VKGFLVPRKIIALSLALACLVSGAIFAHAATQQSSAAHHALDYVRTLQNPDGGFPAFGSDSSPGATIDAILAFAAGGVDANGVKKSGASPVDYLESQAAAYSDTAGGAAKLIVGLVAVGEDPRDFAHVDYVAKMRTYYDSSTHRYGVQTMDQAIYMLARESLGLSPQAGTAAYLESKQMADGCWEFADGMGCDTNTTALAVQALVVAGVDPADAPIQAVLTYFESAQNADGGFPYLAPGDSDANSTAFVLQALVAADEDVNAGGPWEESGKTPLQALLGFQDDATGAFTRFGQDNAYATYQAVPAILLQPLLLPPATDESTSTPRPTATPAATATATPLATSMPLPAATALPNATPFAQVLPASTGPTMTLPSSGDGGSNGGGLPDAALSLLLLAGTAIVLLAFRQLRTRE
jgi:iron complex transport system substrate-binding protein